MLVQTDQEIAPFFAISVPRLLVSSLITGGLFDYWWGYRTWRYIEITTGQPKVPFMQALMLGLSNFFLSGRVHRALGGRGAMANFIRFGIPLAFILLGMLWRLSDVGWLLSSLASFPLAAFQYRIIQANFHVAGHANLERRFTPGAVFALIAGVPLFGLGIVDIVAPESLGF